MPALIEALRDENSYVRYDAAMALSKFGADGQEAGPSLTLALKDTQTKVRTATGWMLKKVDPQAASKAGIP